MSPPEGEVLPIPQPPTRFLLGNLGDIDPTNAPSSFWRLADIYGPIFKLDLVGRRTIICSSHELGNDLCDSSRFEKPISSALVEVRAFLKDGLFTARNDEPNWGAAHRILMPVFGPLGIRKMFGGMMDLISQMVLRWDRLGPNNEILCSDDFTRLAFDVIGLCAFDYRFNSFYTDKPNPFLGQMVEVLRESGKRSRRLPLENQIRVFAAAERDRNIKAMHDVCDDIIAERIAHPQPDSHDLLNAMLEGTDPVTGQKLSRENVRYNMATFLVAGHETTSGTLGFLFYHFLQNPATMLRAQKEVDDVIGDGPIEIGHLSKLVYIKYSIFEALRFMGPIGIIAKRAKNPDKIAGKYEVQPTDEILLNLRTFHHDPKVWGDDADTFRPERFLNGGYENLPPNSFKAFGDGERACIGRAFAEQEMIIAVACILQKFQVEMADPSYKLHLSVALTLKPGDFRIKVRRRPGRDPSKLSIDGHAPQSEHVVSDRRLPSSKTVAQDRKLNQITVLYASQAGTCKSYAEELQTNAPRYGFVATTHTLDSATEQVPKDQPVIIITPSYEGKPADNARKFVKWLETLEKADALQGVSFALFGVGNSDWAQTFHRIPKLVDTLLEKHGANRFTKTGFADVKFDIMGPWEEWTESMWEDLRKLSGTTGEIVGGSLEAQIVAPKFVTHLGGSNISYGTVKVNKELGGKSVGLLKKHMEVELPIGTSYRSGDYLVVLPFNPMALARRVLRRFDIQPDDEVIISGTNKEFLSPEDPISAFDLIMTRVELGTPVSQKQLKTIADFAPELTRSKLIELAKDDVYTGTVLQKRLSVLDILEEYTDAELLFGTYLDMLKPLTPRQYSISSSPLANVDFVQTKDGQTAQRLTASITYDVHDEAAWSGRGQFQGVASTYLARQEPGVKVRCFTRPTQANFHLPLDYTKPIIMIAAGTGIAPMRGFIQERATIKAARNTKLGPALLYFGCRDQEEDFIYRDELARWEEEGVVSVRPCFSKHGPEGSHKYVPDRIWEEREELASLFVNKDAKIFVCGSASKLAKSTSEIIKKIWMEKHGKDEDAAQQWLDKVKEDRYVSDIFE